MILLAASVLAFGSCSKGHSNETAESAKELNSFADAVNSESRAEGEYLLSITFANAVLYHASGDVAWDREAKTAFADFSQTYLGDSSVMLNYFSDGKMISVDDGEVEESERDAEELFSKFPYFKVLTHDSSGGGITVGRNSTGTTYTFNRTDTKDIFDKLVGGDIYALVFSIQNPQPEKTQYGETQCVYMVVDGKLVSCRYEFDVKLFDTPAYVPGYSVPEDEYTIDLHVSAKITYENFGDTVEIGSYSPEVSEE